MNVGKSSNRILFLFKNLPSHKFSFLSEKEVQKNGLKRSVHSTFECLKNSWIPLKFQVKMRKNHGILFNWTDDFKLHRDLSLFAPLCAALFQRYTAYFNSDNFLYHLDFHDEQTLHFAVFSELH